MDVISALNVHQTWMMIMTSLSSIRDAIVVFVWSSPLLASIYPVIVLLLILINRSVYRSHGRVIQTFVYEVDRMLYQTALALYRAKPTIVRRKEQLEVLYANKKLLFAFDPKVSGRDYVRTFGALSQDVDYIAQLTQTVIVSPEQQQQISTINAYLQRSRALYARIGGVISVMTLGLYSLVQPSL